MGSEMCIRDSLWATNYLSSVLRDFSICAMILFIIIAALLKAVKLVELKLSKHGIVHPIFPHYAELKSKNNVYSSPNTQKIA